MRILCRFALLLLCVSMPAVALRRASDENDKQTILLMQGERGDLHLKYMYEPPMTSLRLGFEGSPNQLNVITPPPSLDHEVQLREQTALLKRGDILVWLGCFGAGLLNTLDKRLTRGATSKSLFMSDSIRFDFASLRARGVKIVYYQSEPVVSCVMDADVVDEMWDFAWHNIDNCKNHPNAPTQRYVPLAAHATPVTRQKDNPGALLFFGESVFTRPCWGYLQQLMGEQLESEYGAWDDDAYERVLDTHNIYLNLHRGCNTQPGSQNSLWGPVTWRNAKLLNSHALIISERAYSKDEQEFEGLIDFVDMHQIPERYRELVSMNASTRQHLADLRARVFSYKFEPRSIFERAGIYGNLTRE